MFSRLSDRIGQAIRSLRGVSHFTAENIKGTLKEVHYALVEADVALPVVEQFLSQVEARALGQEVQSSLSPDQAFIKIVYDELCQILGGNEAKPLQLRAKPPVVILMVGLQGSGKTTTTAKLAYWLQQQKKSVLLVSTDIYRPAAIEQLQSLAKQIDVAFYPSNPMQRPEDITRAALDEARRTITDIVIIDTAGRLHIDEKMMSEVKAIHHIAEPTETLLVLDSMVGQDAQQSVSAFHDYLPLTGVILSKTDGDSRGGAALSARYITGKPIKFMGTGEKISQLEVFHPDRIAQRILGMGDVLSLIEEVEQKVDKQKAEQLAKKIQKGQRFDLEDFRGQLIEMQKMGNMSDLLDKLPGMTATMKDMVRSKMPENQFKQFLAIINSMTFKERRFPAHIRGSQKKRISSGSGTQIQDINRLLKQFEKMQKTMVSMGNKGGMMKMMAQLQKVIPGGFGGGGLGG